MTCMQKMEVVCDPVSSCQVEVICTELISQFLKRADIWELKIIFCTDTSKDVPITFAHYNLLLLILAVLVSSAYLSKIL